MVAAGGHQCAAGRHASESSPGSIPHPQFSVDRWSEAPDSILCPSELGSCKSSHWKQTEENTGQDGDRLLWGQVTLICRKVVPGGEAIGHQEGLVSVQSTEVRMMKDAVLHAVLSCRPSLAVPLGAGLLYRQGRWGLVAYEVTIPFSTWRGWGPKGKPLTLS